MTTTKPLPASSRVLLCLSLTYAFMRPQPSFHTGLLRSVGLHRRDEPVLPYRANNVLDLPKKHPYAIL
jgi:hypothetical protein